MLKQIIADELRLLTFRAPGQAVATHWKVYLAFGLFFTWLAGVGRYWDNPRAELWQLAGLAARGKSAFRTAFAPVSHLESMGRFRQNDFCHRLLGSIAYVFVLAAILWLLLAPLRPKNWSYRNVLTFVTLTAPPAVLYAIPVERFLSSTHAAQTNAWFLAIVATWRVGLLGVFLRRVARLPWLQLIVATLLPLAIIVVSLAILNLEHVLFDLMAGIRDEDKSANDIAYTIVFGLAYLSFISAPILGISYVVCVIRAWRSAERPLPPDDRPASPSAR